MALDYTSGPTVMMQLGSFQFGIATAAYLELSRSTEYRWAPQKRFGQLDARQFVGLGDDKVTLPCVVYPEWRGGFDQVENMKAQAATGQPFNLVDGLGKSLGRWVIERVEETHTEFAAAGRPRKMEFTTELSRLPDEEAQGPLSAAAGTVSSVTSAASVGVPAGATTALSKVQGLASSVSSTAASLSGTLTKAAAQVQAQLSPYTEIARGALGSVTRSLGVVGELQDVANRSLSMIGVQSTSINALLGAENLAARANSLITQADSASAILRNSGAKLAALSNVPASATAAMQNAQAAADQVATLTRRTADQAATIKG